MGETIKNYSVDIDHTGEKRIYFVEYSGIAHKIITEECPSWDYAGIFKVKTKRFFSNDYVVVPSSIYWYDNKKRQIAHWCYDLKILRIFDRTLGFNPDFYNQLKPYERNIHNN